MDGGRVMKRLLKTLIPLMVLLGILAYGGMASPARIAGQEGVVSVADETGPPAPAESSRKPVPAGAPSQPSPSAAVVDQEKSSPGP